MSSQDLRVGSLPYLSEAFLAQLHISPAELVKEVERQIIGQRRGEVWCAPKAAVWPGDDRFVMATLGIASEPCVVATKALVLNPRNVNRGIATLNSLITLQDGETGLPIAVIDGNWVTEKRTAALSIVAAKRLANPNSTIAAFIGCGIQARGHLEALGESYPLREMRAFGRGAVNRDMLCQLARSRGLQAVACDTAKAAIEGADIVVTTLTLAPELQPFLDARWLKPGSFTTMVDLALPWLPETMRSFDRIIIDDLEQEAKMIKPMVRSELVTGDLTRLVCGDVPGRQNNDERTTFAFRGLAVGDLAVAGHAYVRAKSIGAL